MEIQISDKIALGSLIIATLAYRHSVKSSRNNAKEIQKLSNEHLQLTSNIAISKASQKYVSLLASVNKEFEEISRKFSTPAFKASTQIGGIFDDFDTQNLTHPYLRHAFHKSIIIVREAYDNELTYQTGLNLSDQLQALKFIKDEVLSHEPELPKTSILSIFKKHNPSRTPAEEIRMSSAFWKYLKIIYERIPEKKEAELFRRIFPFTEEYSKLHKESRPRLEELEKRLDDAIKENSLEMFNIRRIPGLGDKFYRVKGDINRIRHLHFPDFHAIKEISVRDGISYSLYVASILFIVSQHYSWGKK